MMLLSSYGESIIVYETPFKVRQKYFRKKLKQRTAAVEDIKCELSGEHV